MPARPTPRTLIAVIAMALATPAFAAIPPAVDGQPVPSLAPMLAKVTPAVVNISTKTRIRTQGAYFNDPLFAQLFGQGIPRERVEQSLGSGVVVDAAKGYILTNNHVVGGSDDITVTLQDGRDFKAKLIGTDPDTDVAVLQIPAERLQALPVADSAQLRVGDFVVAVGDPFGLGQTATSGMVSALNRTGLGKGIQNFIQTDASINPGNSGGALVNLRGELVGINSMIFTPSGGNVGIGFAIPTDLATGVMKQLLAYGKVRRGNLGVEVQDITPRIASALGLKDTQGAVVTGVTAGSPADGAGLQTGDVLTAIDGKPVRSAQEVRNTEGLLPVGSSVKLSVQREGKPRDVTASIEAAKLATVEGGKVDKRLSGVVLTDLTPEQKQAGLYGVALSNVQPGSAAYQAGLRDGDVVAAIGQRRVPGVKGLPTTGTLGGRQLLLTVVRDDAVYYAVL
ncbi:Do family serine endopeptidase [Luteibacter aegosomaticola]|uniref:Do family serine endopeptidase n=1 Tax=Luteibacter aegosomaticola TaxID=2911538 RepID=UPI001FF85163|nr:Do family serine endopeptidase [Luteibacter aegosomaticola]UPG89513.1 Do family serine endopeptidase [Luteibacter aegosomaticola]